MGRGFEGEGDLQAGVKGGVGLPRDDRGPQLPGYVGFAVYLGGVGDAPFIH